MLTNLSIQRRLGMSFASRSCRHGCDVVYHPTLPPPTAQELHAHGGDDAAGYNETDRQACCAVQANVGEAIGKPAHEDIVSR